MRKKDRGRDRERERARSRRVGRGSLPEGERESGGRWCWWRRLTREIGHWTWMKRREREGVDDRESVGEKQLRGSYPL